jgi:hypothetical protein
MAETEKTDEPLARVTMRLPQSLWDEVQHRAIDVHVSLSDFVKVALEDYLSRNKPRPKTSYEFGLPRKGGKR